MTEASNTHDVFQPLQLLTEISNYFVTISMLACSSAKVLYSPKLANCGVHNFYAVVNWRET